MALAVVLDNLDAQTGMQSKACWRAAVWLASTCRELRERSTTARKRATLQWVDSARSAMFQFTHTINQMPHPLDDDFVSFRVMDVCGLLKKIVERVKEEGRKCALMDEDLALTRAVALLPFLREVRNLLRLASRAIDEEYASYYRRHRLQPRTSTFNIQGRMALALEAFEYHMGWRTDRPFMDAHFRTL